ncbi:MAG TPA: polysaccharide biosynthesis/export family protein [Pyrinomonadaceae bacterium]|nr:polysaccharide biosynthesis/export family protein [Pyrinomonadaceae bacterium]
MMKVKLAAALAALALSVSPLAAAQEKGKKKDESQKPAPAKVEAEERLEADDAATPPAGVPEEVLAHRHEQMNEEAEALIPYYNNFMSSYRLGPEDVISVNVFGHERYSKANIVIPPDGRIDYFFIREGLHVTGKTTRQVADDITHHLEEYLIDPKVTVSLEKAMSYRYGVLGDVAKPGIFVMSRRLSVYEALVDAGGILRTGKKQVVLLRWNADRMIEKQVIDVAAIERGQAPDNYFLRPGDQIFVPGNKWKTVDKIMQMIPVISFARIFTGGF